MSASVAWTGLDELQEALRTMPENLAREAGPIVATAAVAAATALRADYPVHSGKLGSSVRVVADNIGAHGAAMLVKNTAKHAHLFEYGTQLRHSAFGDRGAMPARPIFGAIVSRERRGMYAALRTMLEDAGFLVSGDV